MRPILAGWCVVSRGWYTIVLNQARDSQFAPVQRCYNPALASAVEDATADHRLLTHATEECQQCPWNATRR